MTPDDRIVRINHSLELLSGYVAGLRRKTPVTAAQLIADDDLRAVIERNLQLASEVVLDIANQIIAEFRYRTPEQYKESILILGEEGVLEKGFAESFAGIAGLRNILVHDYRKIDYEKIADKVNNRLGDFETFASSVAAFIQ